MSRLDGRDFLIIAVVAGMIVRPGDCRSLMIITNVTTFIGLRMPSVKEMRAAHSAEGTKRRSQILMISRRENTAAALTEARDALTILTCQSITYVNCEQPQLIEVRAVQCAQNGILCPSV